MVIYFQERESKATKTLCSHFTMLEKKALWGRQNLQKYTFQGWSNRIETVAVIMWIFKGCISGNPFCACQTKPKGLSYENLLSNNSFDDHDVMMVSTNPTLNC